MRSRSWIAAGFAGVLALGTSACTSDDAPAAAPASTSTPSPSPTRTTDLGSAESGPAVTCAPRFRSVSIDTKSRPLPPYATTAEEALQRAIDFFSQQNATDSALYVRENFERIAPAQGYRKENQQATYERFAGYRPDASVFVIVEFARVGPENSWVRGEIALCLLRSDLDTEVVCPGSTRRNIVYKLRPNDPPILSAEEALDRDLAPRSTGTPKTDLDTREKFELYEQESSRNLAVFIGFRDDDSVFAKPPLTWLPANPPAGACLE